MVRATESLLEEALDLPESERAELAAALLRSLDPEYSSPEIEAAWAIEIQKRIRSIDAGEVKMIPWEEVRARLESKLREG